ncbi:hypothetical protein ACIQUM_40290 [Amycolatopsis azurea]|uniref:hypothetical protein n=1 Tax=Amycolatopsis azurea TaxID=36819 RepID=UPI0038270ADE
MTAPQRRRNTAHGSDEFFTTKRPRRWPWILGAVIAAAALSTTLALVLLGNERAEPAGASKSTASPCKTEITVKIVSVSCP